MVIDYKSESERLDKFEPGEQTEFWKPEPGQYKVKALQELEDTDPYEEEGKEPKPQVKIRLLVAEKDEVTMTMGIGKSPASLYGQLVLLASRNNNQLKDLNFMIVVTNDGKKNTYTVVELNQ